MKIFPSPPKPVVTGLLFAILAVASCDSPTCACSDPSRFQLDMVRGSSQTGPAGQPLADSIVVLVTRTGEGFAASGVTVAFIPQAGAGSASPVEVVTDSTGVAAAEWTVGPSAGVDTLIVAIPEGTAVLVTATVQ